MNRIGSKQIYLTGTILLVLLGTGFFLWHGPGGRQERTVLIAPGSSTGVIARKLQRARIVRNAAVFRLYAIATGQARRLKAGEYAFPPHSPLQAVAAKLVAGDVIRHAVTIPEGFTITQIARKVAEAGLAAETVFLQAAADPVVNQAWNLPGKNLEGFLFPDTYYFTRGMSPRQMVERMVERFRERVTPDMIAAGRQQGLDLLQLITLASIIEREVQAPEEQKIVASIFHNRLQQRKRLESCATVLYALGRSSGALSWQDLELRSPYNTYRHRGLPPGPIGNPGLSAIRAAAYPAQTKYLFFVVRPDGKHVFSETFEEHKRAKWQQKKARRRTQPDVAGTPGP